MILALYNGYPIVTNDTGSYISSGFTLIPSSDRPIFYGLFIRGTSLGLSLWLTIYTQCCILSYVFIKFLSASIPEIRKAHKVFFLFFASLCTIGGWYASQLMPDIFVAIMILSTLVLLKEDGTRKQNIIMICICFIAVITHNSNYITLTLFSLLLFLGSVIFKRIQRFRIKATILLGICFFSWITLCLSNYIGRKEFVSSVKLSVI